MGKFLRVRGSNPSRLLLNAGSRGLHTPLSPGDIAINDANESVAFLDAGSTDFVKDTIWQWVYNESISGRWAQMTNVWVTRTNLASSLTCLKTGTVATFNGVPSYTLQDGVNIDTTDNVKLNIDLSETYDNISAYAMGGQFKNIANDAGKPVLQAIEDSGTSVVSSQIFRVSDGRLECNVQMSGSAYAGTTKADWEDLIIQSRHSATNTTETRVSGNPTPFTATGFGDVSALPTDVTVGPEVVGNNTDMTWVLSYFCDSTMDFDGFAENTDIMLDELTRTVPLFSLPASDGDSITVDSGPNSGYAPRITLVPAYANSPQGTSGKTLADMKTDLPATLASGQDTLIIGGGANDQVAGDDAADIIAVVDDILTQTDAAFAAGTIHAMVFRGLTPYKGAEPAAWTQQKQDDLIVINTHISEQCAARSYAGYGDLYSTLVSKAVPEALQGLYWISGSPQGLTSPIEGRYSQEGYHTDVYGAIAGGGVIDRAILALRYYKGGRT